MARVANIKDKMVQNLREQYEGVSNLLVCDFTGVDGPQMLGLRKRLKERGLKMEVVKTRIAARAMTIGSVKDLLSGPCALISAPELDVVELAKGARECARDVEGFRIKGAVAEGALLSRSEAERLVSIPARKQLCGELVGYVSMPLMAAVAVLQHMMGGLVTVLEQIGDKRGE